MHPILEEIIANTFDYIDLPEDKMRAIYALLPDAEKREAISWINAAWIDFYAGDQLYNEAIRLREEEIQRDRLRLKLKQDIKDVVKQTRLNAKAAKRKTAKNRASNVATEIRIV